MKEIEWAKEITWKLTNDFRQLDSSLRVDASKRLIYANEIKEYDGSSPQYHDMAYQTDILVYELLNDNCWKPRVVIETKVGSVTTHDAITYSQKASTHKSVHPYLRYGIFLGNMGNRSLPGRLFRHGAHFDFMLSWQDYSATDREWASLVEILQSEIQSSRLLEEMIFKSRNKDRKRYSVLHKPLVTKRFVL